MGVSLTVGTGLCYRKPNSISLNRGGDLRASETTGNIAGPVPRLEHGFSNWCWVTLGSATRAAVQSALSTEPMLAQDRVQQWIRSPGFIPL